MTKILIIHGPNLNLLGKREPGVYGTVTIDEINKNLRQIAKKKGTTLEIFQSNHEGEIVDKIGKAKNKFAGLLINPAAYTHTSVAIRDAISATDIPTVEVHLSNIYSREDFRRASLVAPVAKGQIAGFGVDSYIYGLEAVIKLAKKKT